MDRDDTMGNPGTSVTSWVNVEINTANGTCMLTYGGFKERPGPVPSDWVHAIKTKTNQKMVCRNARWTRKSLVNEQVVPTTIPVQNAQLYIPVTQLKAALEELAIKAAHAELCRGITLTGYFADDGRRAKPGMPTVIYNRHTGDVAGLVEQFYRHVDEPDRSGYIYIVTYRHVNCMMAITQPGKMDEESRRIGSRCCAVCMNWKDNTVKKGSWRVEKIMEEVGHPRRNNGRKGKRKPVARKAAHGGEESEVEESDRDNDSEDDSHGELEQEDGHATGTTDGGIGILRGFIDITKSKQNMEAALRSTLSTVRRNSHCAHICLPNNVLIRAVWCASCSFLRVRVPGRT